VQNPRWGTPIWSFKQAYRERFQAMAARPDQPGHD